MVGEEMKDNRPEEELPPLDKTYGVGTIPEEDIGVGQYVCVLALKQQPKQGAPIMGQSLLVKAVCLPYFVAQLLSDPDEPTLTLDVRFLKLMRVTKEFVDAQRAGARGQQQGPPPAVMPVPPPVKRKKNDT